MNGKSDPYVVLQLGEQKYKTTIVKKNLSPIWNEDFIIDVNDKDTDELLVNVFDHVSEKKKNFLMEKKNFIKKKKRIKLEKMTQ